MSHLLIYYDMWKTTVFRNGTLWTSYLWTSYILPKFTWSRGVTQDYVNCRLIYVWRVDDMDYYLFLRHLVIFNLTMKDDWKWIVKPILVSTTTWNHLHGTQSLKKPHICTIKAGNVNANKGHIWYKAYTTYVNCICVH